MTPPAWHTRPVPSDSTLTLPFIDAGDVVLRKAAAQDRGPIIEHVTNPDVRAHLGGPQARGDVERDLDEAGIAAATGSPGSYVIAVKETDAFIGTMSLTRRGVHHPGHIRPTGEELELAYTLDRPVWGRGLAFDARAGASPSSAGLDAAQILAHFGAA